MALVAMNNAQIPAMPTTSATRAMTSLSTVGLSPYCSISAACWSSPTRS